MTTFTRRSLRLISFAAATFPAACIPPSVDEPPAPQTHRQSVTAADACPTVKNDFFDHVLAETDETILNDPAFSLKNVLTILTTGTTTTPLELFRQWWDVFNPKPGLNAGPHCDDLTNAEGTTVLAGTPYSYPYACRPGPLHEGVQAGTNPFAAPETANPDAYVPIGLFNRLDLMPDDGTNCGEYRIVYAKRSGMDKTNGTRLRNLLIFEARLPNKSDTKGVKGCRKVADEWKALENSTTAKRLASLKKIYFTGLSPLGPAITASNFMGDSGGQIRTNQFIAPPQTKGWSLREFKLETSCTATNVCKLKVVPATVKVNPFGELFSAMSTHPSAPAFRTAFLAQVKNLAADDDPNAFFMTDLNAFDGAQSEASSSIENNYLTQFSGHTAFRNAIAAQLAAIPSSLTPEDIVARAQALSCAGCHRLTNPNTTSPDTSVSLGGQAQAFPSLGFTHVAENERECYDAKRFKISPALRNALLPVRKHMLLDFTADKAWKTNKHTVH